MRLHVAGCRVVLALALGGLAVPVRAELSVPATSPATASVDVPVAFDAAGADDAHLARYGFPPRPDRLRAPDAYRSWMDAVAGVQRIVPVLQSVPVRHGPMRNRARGIAATAATSSNWSGYVVAAPAYDFGQQSLVGVHGDWMLPVAQPAFGACSHTPDGAEVYSSSWVGLDGDGSGDVLQAGTESDAVCSQGQVGAYQGAWYEWYPYDEVRVVNLPVTPGAAVYVHVWASSATRGHAYIVNKSARLAASVTFEAPPGTRLVGNSAEWIVERPTVNEAQTTLTNYVQETFANARAADAQKNYYYPGNALIPGAQPALQVQMADGDARIISVPTLLGQGAIWFRDEGPAKFRLHG